MAFMKVTLVLVGILIVGSMGAVALVPLVDSSCHASFTNLHPERATGMVLGASLEAAGRGRCDRTPDPCPAGNVVPAPTGGGTALVRFEIDNRQRPVEARVCLTDVDGTKRADLTRAIMTGTTLVLDLEVPKGVYDGGFRIDGGRLFATYHNIDPTECPDQAIKVPARVAVKFFGGVTQQSNEAACMERQQPDDDAPPVMETRSGEPPWFAPPTPGMVQGTAAAIALVSGGALAVVALVRTDRWRWMLAFLFTRIHPPKALDHRVRSAIEALVAERPGLRPEAIRKSLELGHGQTAHHLRVLMHAGVLESLRVAGSDHLFPAGRYDHEKKRRLALLDNEAARRLYDAIRTSGEGDVSTLARRIRISVPYASRLAGRLAAEGLVARRREGNRVVLRVDVDVTRASRD